jgi:hypothetical protein
MASAKIGAQFAKHFVKGEVLVPHLNNFFLAAKWPDEFTLTIRPNKERDTAFHPSSALACELELYARMTGEARDEQTRVEAEKTFAVGRLYHELMAWVVIEGLGFSTWDEAEKEYNFRFPTAAGNEVWVRGFADLGRVDIPGSGTFLVDYKTVASRLYSMSQLPHGKEEQYRAQVALYLEMEDLDEALIVFLEKDNPHRFKELRVQRDGALVDDVMEGWERVADAVAAGEPPACTCYRPENCPARHVYA